MMRIELLSHDFGQGGLGAVGDDFEGVDEVVAAGGEFEEVRGFGAARVGRRGRGRGAGGELADFPDPELFVFGAADVGGC